MDDKELQRLQKENFTTVLLWLLGVVAIYFFASALLTPQKIAQPSWWPPVLIAVAVYLSCYRLYRTARFRSATYLLIGGQIVAISSFIFHAPEQFFITYGYLLVIVVSMAGMLIQQRAVPLTATAAMLTVWLADLLVVGSNQQMAFYVLPVALLPLFGLLIIAAAIGYISANHLTATVKWALRSQEKAQRRSDELFKSQQETARAKAELETKNMRLQQAYAEIEQKRHQLEILYRYSREISRTLALDEVLALIMTHLVEIVPHERTAVLLESTETEEELEIIASRGFPPAVDPLNLQIPIKGEDVYDRIRTTHKPLAYEDVTKLSDWHQVEGLALARSWLGVPLIRASKVLGMLSLVRETAQPFTQDEIALAASFAGEAASSLENARLYDELSRFSKHLEEMVAERTRQLQVERDKLNLLNQKKSDFIKTTSHELRTPLTSISNYSQMLLSDEAIKNNPFHAEMVGSIYNGAGRLHEIINTMLDVFKLDEGALEIHPQMLPLGYLVKQVARKLQDAVVERNQTLVVGELSHLPFVEADPRAMEKVFHGLLINAIKYTPDGGTITVEGRAVAAGEVSGLEGPGVEIVVRDTGIGIDPRNQQVIFEKFYQTGDPALQSSGKTKFKGYGPGLGLAIVKGIVQLQQGQVWVESAGHDEEQLPGSQFYVVLPLKQQTKNGVV